MWVAEARRINSSSAPSWRSFFMCRLQSSNLRSSLPFHVIIRTWMTSGNKWMKYRHNVGILKQEWQEKKIESYLLFSKRWNRRLIGKGERWERERKKICHWMIFSLERKINTNKWYLTHLCKFHQACKCPFKISSKQWLAMGFFQCKGNMSSGGLGMPEERDFLMFGALRLSV